MEMWFQFFYSILQYFYQGRQTIALCCKSGMIFCSFLFLQFYYLIFQYRTYDFYLIRCCESTYCLSFSFRNSVLAFGSLLWFSSKPESRVNFSFYYILNYFPRIVLSFVMVFHSSFASAEMSVSTFMSDALTISVRVTRIESS